MSVYVIICTIMSNYVIICKIVSIYAIFCTMKFVCIYVRTYQSIWLMPIYVCTMWSLCAFFCIFLCTMPKHTLLCVYNFSIFACVIPRPIGYEILKERKRGRERERERSMCGVRERQRVDVCGERERERGRKREI